MNKDLCILSFPQCTTYDLLEKGMEVHIVADAVSSRRYLSVLCLFCCIALFSSALNIDWFLRVSGNCILTTFVSPPTARRTVCLLCPDWSRAELTSPPQRLFCFSWFKTLNTPTSRRCLLQLFYVALLGYFCLFKCVKNISLAVYSKGKLICHVLRLL